MITERVSRRRIKTALTRRIRNKLLQAEIEQEEQIWQRYSWV